MCTTSGLASASSAVTSLKCARTGNLSESCFAISGSLSQTPTIADPAILWICDTWASAILPQPTIATLSIGSPSPAGFEVTPEAVRGRHALRPPEERLELLVAVLGALPVRVPPAAGKDRRQLPL